MKTGYSYLFVTVALLMLSFQASAQESSDESAVWAVIEMQWERQQRGDKRWTEQMIMADFMGWQKASPAPRNKASTRMWNEFEADQGKMLQHELYPLSIVVHGNMAVAHYLYSQAIENKQDEVTVSSGRYTDVLVRDDGQWKFIAWHGGDDND